MRRTLLSRLFILTIGLTITLPIAQPAAAQQDQLPNIDESPFETDPAGVLADPATQPRGRSTRSRQLGQRRSTRGLGRPSEDIADPLSPEQAQPVEVTERFAGWNEASDGLGNRRIGEALRANWAMVDPNGLLTGTVIGIDGAEVAGMKITLLNNGRVVKATIVQPDGSYEFTNLREGAYSVIGWGDGAFFAYGLNILGYNEDADENVLRSLKTYAFQNETSLNNDWIRFYSPNVKYRVYGRYEQGETESDSPSLYGLEGLFNFTPDAQPATSVGGTPVKLGEDGLLIGRVHQFRSLDGRPVDLRSTRVLLVKNDSVVASTTTDNFGVFEFFEVPPGGYGLIAASDDGIGMVGLIAEEAEEVELSDDGELVETESPARPFDFCLVPAETAGWINHAAQELAYQRAVLAPRPPKPPGPPEFDYDAFARGVPQAPAACHRKDLTFAQWQALGCGRFPKRDLFANATRRLTDRIDNVFERTFYPDSGSNGLTGGPAPNQNVAPQQFAPAPAFPTSGVGFQLQDTGVAPGPAGGVAPGGSGTR